MFSYIIYPFKRSAQWIPGTGQKRINSVRSFVFNFRLKRSPTFTIGNYKQLLLLFRMGWNADDGNQRRKNCGENKFFTSSVCASNDLALRNLEFKGFICWGYSESYHFWLICFEDKYISYVYFVLGRFANKALVEIVWGFNCNFVVPLLLQVLWKR